MVKAILVLRIHLFELEKVNELCRDFSDRYIETLKVKLNSDNIFKSDEDLNDTQDLASCQLSPGEHGEQLDENTGEDLDSRKSPASENNSTLVSAKKKKSRKSDKRTFKLKTSTSSSTVNSTSTPTKRSPKRSFEISPDTCLGKISLNTLSLNGTSAKSSNKNNSNNDSSYQSIGSSELDDEMTRDGDEVPRGAPDHDAVFKNSARSTTRRDRSNTGQSSSQRSGHDNTSDEGESECPDDETTDECGKTSFHATSANAQNNETPSETFDYDEDDMDDIDLDMNDGEEDEEDDEDTMNDRDDAGDERLSTHSRERNRSESLLDNPAGKTMLTSTHTLFGHGSSGSRLDKKKSSDEHFMKHNLKTKRGILPKNATNVMKKWLFQHIVVSEVF